MLRRNTNQNEVTKNNWVFSSAHGSVKRDAAAVDGSLEATLAVNRVSVSGEAKK